jgi:hypothetical protein
MKSCGVFLCAAALMPLACILSFFSFFFRADSWQEVGEATRLNFIVIGPIWAAVVFLWLRTLSAGIRRSTIAAIVTYVLVASGHSAWTAAVLKVRLGPTPTVAVAKQQLFLVQAIVDYRAENGMLPYSLEDLVPTYLNEVPTGQVVRWLQNTVWYKHHPLYRFGKNEGWEGLGLPVVEPTRPVKSGDALIRARLAEYDRRIASAPANAEHYSDRIAYLLILGRRADALETCRAAARALPDHWRPRLGLAALADPSDVAGAEQECHDWLERHPAFIRYWYLARYYRDRNRHADAVSALRLAANYPLEALDDGSRFVPTAYAFDAAKYAYEQREYELVLDLTRAWSQPRGVYSNPGDDLHAFRAASELALGRVDEARQSVAFVWPKYRQGGLWAGNLEALHRAVIMGDRTFVYDPGNFGAIDKWKLFPSSNEIE